MNYDEILKENDKTNKLKGDLESLKNFYFILLSKVKDYYLLSKIKNLISKISDGKSFFIEDNVLYSSFNYGMYDVSISMMYTDSDVSICFEKNSPSFSKTTNSTYTSYEDGGYSVLYNTNLDSYSSNETEISSIYSTYDMKGNQISKEIEVDKNRNYGDKNISKFIEILYIRDTEKILKYTKISKIEDFIDQKRNKQVCDYRENDFYGVCYDPISRFVSKYDIYEDIDYEEYKSLLNSFPIEKVKLRKLYKK